MLNLTRPIDLFGKAKCLYTIYHEISLISEISGINSSYEISDELWNQIFTLLVHKPKRKKKTGRPRMNDRKAMTAIFYIVRTGCQWKALPRSLGASSTVHDRFQEWRNYGVFKQMWIDGLKLYDEKIGINWKWQSMDGAITKAPLGGKKYRTKSHRQKK